MGLRFILSLRSNYSSLFTNFVSMKEVVLKWRDRDITVKYRCINFGGFHYAIVLDKDGEEVHLHRQRDGDRLLWKSRCTFNWPKDLIELLSDFFDQQVPEWRKPER